MELTLSLQTVMTVFMIAAPTVFILGNIPYIKNNWKDALDAWPIVWRCSLGMIFSGAVSTTCWLQVVALGSSSPVVVAWGVGGVVGGIAACALLGISICAICDEI